MHEVAIRADGLGKRYRIGARAAYQTLRERLSHLAATPWRHRHRKKAADQGDKNIFWALRDVSFEVRRGDVVGIIGRNGAGKSTLLKILSRITEPTVGEADLHGRVGSLLEVGTGFHPELTGRENIYLNGAILGMKRTEIVRKFDEIVAFAEVEQFVDTAVKHYSSGMYMRLAFAVAAHLETEILVVDEVLAVGDAPFQKKCLGKMGQVAKDGRTVLFVSHNMGAVQNLCDRVVLLEAGCVRMTGTAAQALRLYMASSQNSEGRLNLSGRRFAPKKVEILDAWLERDGAVTGLLQSSDSASVVLRLKVLEPVRFSVELILRQQDGVPVAFAPSGLAQDWELTRAPGELTVRCRLPAARHAAGQYTIDLIVALTGSEFLDYIESGLGFRIDAVAIGSRNWLFSQNAGQGYSVWPVHYSVQPESDGAHVAR